MYTLHSGEIGLFTGYISSHIYNFIIIRICTFYLGISGYTSFSGGRGQEEHSSKPAQAHILYCSLINSVGRWGLSFAVLALNSGPQACKAGTLTT
jgi:hypothetical protein